MNDQLLLHDSETLKHINKVREKLWILIQELDKRAQIHDQSKFETPEREIFAENTPKLAKTEYGSEEYKKLLTEVQPAIDHHYSSSGGRHHPEHWPNGINDMDLVDIVELICDWSAATERNLKGNIHKSIEKNVDRFGLSEQLTSILKNTVNRYF